MKLTIEVPGVHYNLNGDELATILHGLRILQEVRKPLPAWQTPGCTAWEQANVDSHKAQSIYSCDHFEDWNPLTDEQIDALAEKINPLDATIELENGLTVAIPLSQPVQNLDSHAAQILKHVFPWLGTDEQASGADVVGDLAELYAKLTGTPATNPPVHIGTEENRPKTAEEKRLEYLRSELRNERISYSELAELQSLAPHIAPDDVELRQAAGLPEE